MQSSFFVFRFFITVEKNITPRILSFIIKNLKVG